MGIYSELTPRIVLVGFVASFSLVAFGYDVGWWGFIIGAPYFNAVFGSQTVVTATGISTTVLSSTEISVGTGLGAVGLILGCAIAPYFNERFGRKFCIVIGAIGQLIGTVIQAMCTIKRQYWVLLGGKLFINIAVGISVVVVSVYIAECAPPKARGAMVANAAMIQSLGYVLAAGVSYAMIAKMSAIQWLLPICLQVVMPLIVLASIGFLPESPRWLIKKGRIDDATAVIKSLRRNRVSETGELDVVREEVHAITSALDAQSRIHGGNSWLELFRGANGRRTMISVGVASFQQLQGTNFVANYTIILLLSLGFTDPYLISLILYVVLSIGTLGNYYFPDRFGRRLVMLSGAGIMCVCMAIIGAISASFVFPTGNYANLLVAALFIWVLSFANTWASVSTMVMTETPTNRLREKTVALSTICQNICVLLVVFVSPYIQGAEYGNLGGKIGFVWMGFSACAWLFVFFLVPESKGRTLEELDYLFEAHIATRKFAKYDTTELVRAAAPAETEAGSLGRNDLEKGEDEMFETSRV